MTVIGLVLVVQARDGRESVVRPPLEGQPPAVQVGIVDVLHAGRQVVDVPALQFVESDAAQRHDPFPQGFIEHALAQTSPGCPPTVAEVPTSTRSRRGPATGDGSCSERSAHRTRAEKRALRPAQHLDPIHVDEVGKRVEGAGPRPGVGDRVSSRYSAVAGRSSSQTSVDTPRRMYLVSMPETMARPGTVAITSRMSRAP